LGRKKGGGRKVGKMKVHVNKVHEEDGSEKSKKIE
jgi:hypothetical protein